jgi:4-hydroxyphenylacetate 3-monooxygenase
MIRTGDEYRDSLKDGREVYISAGKVSDVSTHSMFKPLVDIRPRIYDMQHEAANGEALTYTTTAVKV